MLNELDCDAFIAQSDSFDVLIDARSPQEFLDSHIPDAQNFYALNDAQHKEIGTIYKHTSRNEAKILGAQYICQNVAAHLKTIAKNHKIGSRIGIYCARGGLRSSSIAIILSHIGYQVFRLKRGYKSYRFYVLSYLQNLPHQNFIVLGGKSGCGKSELLEHLSPCIDLEALAHHRGSSFGAYETQPSQKMFENNLCKILHKINPSEYVFIEAESKRLGKCTIPSQLHTRLLKGYRVEITAPFEQRVTRISKMYENIDSTSFYHAIQTIAPYIKKSIKENIIQAFESQDVQEVISLLLKEYYDIVYKKSSPEVIFENADLPTTLHHLRTLHTKLSNSL